MAKLYISFLGTNNYLSCNYVWDKQKVSDVRFVQAATISLHCRHWTPSDRIAIFTTSKARTSNWEDNGHFDYKTKQPLALQGLGNALRELNLNCEVKRIDIPEGFSEEEVWQIFRALYEHIEAGDEIIFDITHAFRSIPMLAMVLLNYARVMKQAKVGGIYYGAFETLGSAFEAQKIPVEERNVPIIDLTSLEQLMSWSLAIDRFLGTGDASMVTELAQGAVGPIMKATKGKDEAAKSIKALANVLNHFSANIATCRGIEISSSAKEVQENLARCEEIDLIPPMTPLFTRMKEKFADFGHDDISNGIKAVRWCLQHNMVQQGITILVETLITWVKNLVELGGSEEFSRDMISNAAHFYQTQTAKYEWTGEAQKDPEQTQRLLDKISASPDIAEICKILESIRDYRNDINHAGCRQSPRKAKEFFNQLEKSVSKCDSILNRIKMKPS